VVSVKVGRCSGLPDDRLPDGRIPASVACGVLGVHLSSDAPVGESGRVVSVQVGGQQIQAGLSVGDRVEVTRVFEAGQKVTYAWADYSRANPLLLLTAVFIGLVLLVARLRGLAALVGLGLGGLAVLFFMLPALQRGEDPALVGLVGSVTIMAVILYMAHGVSFKTSSAFLGTVAGLVVTAGLAHWSSRGAHMDGLTGPDRQLLTQITGPQTVASVVVCGFVLAGLGVLNDVTVTQASSVWELRAAAPAMRGRQLFVSGMRIGRDHLASTVYTIAFAYAGAALPSILLVTFYDLPLGQLLTTGDIAEEVVRSIGLILAIPLTTAVAAAVAATATIQTDPDALRDALPVRRAAGATGSAASDADSDGATWDVHPVAVAHGPISRAAGWWRQKESESAARLSTQADLDMPEPRSKWPATAPDPREAARREGEVRVDTAFPEPQLPLPDRRTAAPHPRRRDLRGT
jgi:uncharacterized membrane protein